MIKKISADWVGGILARRQVKWLVEHEVQCRTCIKEMFKEIHAMAIKEQGVELGLRNVKLNARWN